MSQLFNIKSPVLIALVALLFLLMAGQTVHALFIATRKERQIPRGAVLYEALLVAHLLVACSAVCSAYANHGALLFRLKALFLPIEPLMWVNVVALALGMLLALTNRRAVMAPELVVLAACTPPIVEAAGPYSWLIALADAAFFLFRVVAALAMDKRHLDSAITRLSVGEAVKKLPEGVLYVNRKGAIVFMNESMRSCLQALSLGTSLAEGSLVWPGLEKRAAEAAGPRNALLPEGIRLAVSPDETRFFTHDEVTLRRAACERIIAIDVTVEENLNESLSRANAKLEDTNRELEQALAELEEAARAEASFAMRTRIHDSIGQRMTILHHYLECNSESPEATRNITRLMHNITDDLACTVPEGEDELSALASAFALAGTDIRIEGTLPETPAEASAVVGIIREAATNALKHGNAKTVSVRIEHDATETRLSVSNDGTGAQGPIAEGCGLPQMRHAAQALGGSFSVSAAAPFTVSAAIPHPGGPS